MPSSRAAAASAGGATGPRRNLTLQQKVLIIEKREREGLKQDELAQWAAAEFALPSVPTQPTISNILRSKDKLQDALRRNPQRRIKSVREVTCPSFEDAVVSWILSRTRTTGPDADPRPVDRRAVLEFAGAARHEFPRAQELMLSEGWLSRLLTRRRISLRPGGNDNVNVDEHEEKQREPATTAPSTVTVAAVAASEAVPSTPELPSSRTIEPSPSLPQAAPADASTNLTSAASASVSPTWQDAASPVFASTPAQGRARHERCSTAATAFTTIASSGHDSPVGLRSLARAASPLTTVRVAASPRRLDASKVYEQVCAYYSTHLQSTRDVRTNAPMASAHGAAMLPPFVRDMLQAVPDAVSDRFFGCGLPLPLGIDGLHALDLGCGSGRDAYVLSALVGPSGSVTGVDMAPPLLSLAKQHVAAFTARLGSVPCAHLRFLHGYIEYLDQVGIASDCIDLAIANFAISLTPDKRRALDEIFRVLRSGGEFYFSDVFALRRVPERLRDDAVAFSEGLGSAMYLDDFTALCRDVGFGEPRQVSFAPISITDEALASRVGAMASEYRCITFRCFKVPHLELREREEDYGHVARYLGTITGHEAVYELDAQYRFEARRPVRVGGNTAAVLQSAWLARHFHVDGDWSDHFGRFIPSPR